MKIHYKKGEVQMNIFLGVIWLAWGVFLLGSGKFDAYKLYEISTWLGVIMILLAASFFMIYFNQVRNQYLTIDEGIIKQNWPYGKEMKLEEIKQIKNSKGMYILQTELQKMKINLNLIDDKSKLDLNNELMKLGVKWE